MSKNIFHQFDIKDVNITSSILLPNDDNLAVVVVGARHLIIDGVNSSMSMAFYQRYLLDHSLSPVKIDGIGVVSSIDFYKVKSSIQSISRLDNVDAQDLSQAEKELDSIFENAVSLNTSDIHIRRDDYVATVSFRINGSLRDISAMSVKMCDSLIFVLYNVLASTKESSWNVAYPQDANVVRNLSSGSYRFRYAHMPIFGVESGCYHVVMRIIKVETGVVKLSDDDSIEPLNKLRLPNSTKDVLVKIMQQPYGLLVVCGVTGSGKSTSLKAMMEWMYYKKYAKSGVFLTVEDPVEYKIGGAIQSSVVRKNEDTDPFLPAIKSAMRRDPDVLMVGETRDPHTAKAIIGAVESGHYCLTTVHAGSVIAALQRMESLGVSKSRLSVPGFLAGIMAQSLVPKMCDHCKIEMNDSHYVMRVYQTNINGCEHCNYTGVVSRQLVVEVFFPGQKELELLAVNDVNGIYREWRRLRDNTLSLGFEIKEKIYIHVVMGDVDARWFRDFYGDIEQSSKEIILNAIQYQ